MVAHGVRGHLVRLRLFPRATVWAMSFLKRWRARRGRILAVKWGYNPNSSSLGVDVTFLIFGALAIALLTPFVAVFVRARRASRQTPQP